MQSKVLAMFGKAFFNLWIEFHFSGIFHKFNLFENIQIEIKTSDFY